MKNIPVVLITGASRGIGRSIALAFAREKYKVALNFLRSREKARAVAAEAESLGAGTFMVQADVGDSADVKAMVRKIEKKWGGIDILINNAGVTRDRTILKMNDEEWNEVLRVDLSGAFWCLRECAKVMVKREESSIVNVSSIVGVRGSAGNSNYSAAKAGLIGLTKSVAKELGRFNVRVNAVLPGFHLTDMGAEVWGKYAERIRSEHALGRLTDLEEFSRFVVFLAEQRSVSGQVFNFESRVI